MRATGRQSIVSVRTTKPPWSRTISRMFGLPIPLPVTSSQRPPFGNASDCGRSPLIQTTSNASGPNPSTISASTRNRRVEPIRRIAIRSRIAAV